jgi:uncharacterized protein
MLHRTLVLWFCMVFAAFAGDDARFVGDWKGDLVVGRKKVPFIFHVVASDGGGLKASLDSPAEKLTGLAVESVTTTSDGQITFDLKVVAAVFSAKLTSDESKLEGTWTQRGVSLPLHLSRSDAEVFEKVKGQERFIGIFEGAIDAGPVKPRLVFHLAEDAAGRLSGTMVQGLLLGSVEVGEDGTFAIVVSGVGSFDGKISADGQALDGTWTQGGAELPLVARRIDKPTERKRPQTPQPPFPYRVEDVEFENEADGVVFAGTLTSPKEGGPFACAILITGSGPQDRDETIFEHKPFLVIADALTRRGVAVLRYDDRGVGKSTGSMAKATSEDYARDAAAAMDFVASRPDIDKRRIGLIGHSEGGLIAPMIAAHRADVAFAVLIAGPGVDGERILLEQAALIERAAGQTEENIAAVRRIQEVVFPIAKDRTLSDEECAAKIREAVATELAAESDEIRKAAEGEVATMSSPWMRYFLSYDPIPALQAMRCPTLALLGEKDLQVPAAINASAIRAAFEPARAAGAILEVEIREGLNHLFQRCETGAIAEYLAIEHTIDPAALERIVGFVVTHSKARN